MIEALLFVLELFFMYILVYFVNASSKLGNNKKSLGIFSYIESTDLASSQSNNKKLR
jgi:hypothetical protein